LFRVLIFIAIAGVLTFLSISRRKTEAALREKQEQYKIFVEHSFAGIYLVQNGKFLYLNRNAASFAGYEPEEMVGMPSLSVVHPEDLDRTKEKAGRMLKGEERSPYECRFVKKDGRIRWIMETVTSIFHDGRKAVLGNSMDITSIKMAEDELRNARDQLRALAARLQDVREETQTIISQDLHDDVGGKLAGLKMDLLRLEGMIEKVPDTDEKSALLKVSQRIKDLINRTIQSARRIMMELRPSVLDDFGLVAALEWQVEEFRTHTGISCEFHSGQPQIDLDKRAATAVFRIFQEALANVTRHSGARGVAAVLRINGDALVLEVKDDGRGITEDQLARKESLGLMGMKERALALGGTVRIRGESGKGTTVTLRVPLNRGG
jgi:PAS domain S-box-containing protein